MRARWTDDGLVCIVDVRTGDDDAEWELSPFNVSLCHCDDGSGGEDEDCATRGRRFHVVVGSRTTQHALRHPVALQTSEAIALAHAELARHARGLVLHEVSLSNLPCEFPQAVLQLGTHLRRLVLRHVHLVRFPAAACRALAGTLHQLDVSCNATLLWLPHEMGLLRALYHIDMDALLRYPPSMQRLNAVIRLLVRQRDSTRYSAVCYDSTRYFLSILCCEKRPKAAAYALLAVWRKRHKRRGMPVYLAREAARLVLYSAGEVAVWGPVENEGEGFFDYASNEK